MAGIGEIGVRVSADTTDFVAGMNRTQQIAQTSMARVEQASRVAKAASDKFVQSLQYQVDTFGKSEAEILRYKADLLGASDAAKPLIAQLETMAATTGAHAGSVKSAAEETHKFSLESAGAKRELLVLAHELSQGNFKRFGGSMMVLGEQTGAAGMLFSAAGIAALGFGAAIIGIGAAIVKGAAEQRAMNNALIETGNYAGTTGDALNAMAHDAVALGGSIGEAKKAVTDLAGSGKFTAQEIGQIADAAIAMEHATGKSIDETIKNFEQLAVQSSVSGLRSIDMISRAALKLDDQYHFLTESVYEQIRALEKEGDQKAASALAIEALAKTTKERAEEMAANLGTLARAWNHVKEAIGGAVDVANNIGKKATPGSDVEKYHAQLVEFDKELAESNARLGRAANSMGEGLAAARLKIVMNLVHAVDAKNKVDAAAIAQGNLELAQSEAKHAAARIEQDDMRLAKKGMTEAQAAIQKYGQDLAKIAAVNPKSPLLNQDVVNQHFAALLKAHQAPAVHIPKPKEYHDDAAVKFLQTLRDQDAAIQSQLKSANNLTEAQKEQAKFEQDLLDFKGKKLTKEQQSLVANQAAIRAQLAKNVADAEELRVKNEVAKLDERARQISEQMASAEASRSELYQRQLGAFGQGRDAQQRVAAMQVIYKEYQRYEDQLIKATPKDLLGSQKFRNEVNEIHSSLTKSLADFDAYYDAIKQKQGDWSNGAESAFQDYLSSAQNVAAQAEGAFTNAFKGMEDVFVQFVTTGKLSFTSLATSILTDIARIQARQAVAGLLNSSFNWGDAIGSMFGPGTVGSGLSGARANGGPVSSGASYLVGERGPEIFTPSGGGTIIPNNALGGSGSAPQINLVTNISGNGSTSSASGDSGGARSLGDALNAKMKAVIVQEMRQGGLIWNYQKRGIAP